MASLGISRLYLMLQDIYENKYPLTVIEMMKAMKSYLEDLTIIDSLILLIFGAKTVKEFSSDFDDIPKERIADKEDSQDETFKCPKYKYITDAGTVIIGYDYAFNLKSLNNDIIDGNIFQSIHLNIFINVKEQSFKFIYNNIEYYINSNTHEMISISKFIIPNNNDLNKLFDISDKLNEIENDNTFKTFNNEHIDKTYSDDDLFLITTNENTYYIIYKDTHNLCYYYNNKLYKYYIVCSKKIEEESYKKNIEFKENKINNKVVKNEYNRDIIV